MIMAENESVLTAALPVNCAGWDAVGDELELDVEGGGWVPATRLKFAQFRRVLFWVWTTIDRFPKKEPRPSSVVA